MGVPSALAGALGFVCGGVLVLVMKNWPVSDRRESIDLEPTRSTRSCPQPVSADLSNGLRRPGIKAIFANDRSLVSDLSSGAKRNHWLCHPCIGCCAVHCGIQ